MAFLMMAIGFAIIGVAWVQSSNAIDVRVHLQLLLSGGFGGLGLITAGAAVLHSHVAASSLGSLRQQLDRVADALIELAQEEQTSGGSSPGATVSPTRPAPDDETTVLASHASYHVQGCDLAEGRDDLRSTTLRAAQEELRPCPVCVPTSRVSA